MYRYIEAKLAEVTAAGATVKEPAHDVGGGRLVATVTDPDPRAPATPYRWFRISLRLIQAWREVNEIPGRELMRDGRWLV